MMENMSELEKSELEEELNHLRARLRSEQKKVRDVSYKDAFRNHSSLSRLHIRKRRGLHGHLAKIYALQWGSDSQHLLSASQDGKLLVWDTYTAKKERIVSLKSSWVMACAYSPTRDLAASGGLDNNVSIFALNRVDEKGQVMANHTKEISGHSGYISCLRFLDDRRILSSSGDKTCILWDVTTAQQRTVYINHTGEVTSVSVSPDLKYFVSGGCDANAKVWDTDEGQCRRTFWSDGDKCDINAVDFHPSGLAFVTGSDDWTCRLYDIRSEQELMVFQHDNVKEGVNSVAFSRSGRLLFAGYNDCICHVWDTFTGEKVGVLVGHEERVSCVGVAQNGTGLATGSWDCSVHIWG